MLYLHIFVTDMLITVIRWKLVGDVGFLIHHITSAVAFLYVIVSNFYGTLENLDL